GRCRDAPDESRHRRDGLRPAYVGRAAASARSGYRVPLQQHPGVAGAARRNGAFRAGGMMRATRLIAAAVALGTVQSGPPARLGFGRPATADEIAAWDIAVRPDGRGLPAGRGTARDGAAIYASRCGSCHGATGQDGPAARLGGREPRDGFPFGRDPTLVKTVGNYWPYATTLY